MGSAPFLGGGFGHFYAYAPEKIRYAIDRYAMEVKRQMDVLDRRLAETRYVAGDDYTIADMAIWPWYGQTGQGPAVWRGRVPAGAHLHPRGALGRRDCAAPGRPRGRMVNRVQGEPSSQLHERHDASDFDTKTQDKLAP
jgi:GST-like protein